MILQSFSLWLSVLASVLCSVQYVDCIYNDRMGLALLFELIAIGNIAIVKMRYDDIKEYEKWTERLERIVGACLEEK